MTSRADTNSKTRLALRARAEALSQTRRRRRVAPTKPEDVARLVHELEIHQIELELQYDELRSTKREVEESRKRFSDLYDFAPVGYLTIDENMVITHANLTIAAMLGVERTRLVGRRFTRFVSRESVDAFYVAQRATGPKTPSWNGELTLTKAAGVKLPITMNIVRVEESGAAVCWHCAVSDVTSRLAAERLQAKRIEQEREEEARRKNEFLAFLSHELRNPLAAIHTAAQVLSRETTPSARAEMEDIIRQQTAMMRRLVDDLLELERITYGHIELTTDALDLAQSLQRVIAPLRSIFATRGQELVLRLPSVSVQFMADSTRLDQIVGNLLTNASKYTAPGGRIELSGATDGSHVVIRCKDNGQGIPLEDHQRIFQPFVRGQGTEFGYRESNVGLGLALVKQLTELHGGTISVDSAGTGLGSEFIVRLPLVLPDRALANEPAGARPSLPQRSIVIVEDNRSVATALRRALEQEGFTVHLFVDGPSTLAAVSELTPHAFLIDIGLPGMDGYELAAKLQQQRATKHVLRIAVSGLKPREGAEADAFDHYFTKPVDVTTLLAVLDPPPPPPKRTTRPRPTLRTEQRG
jgi:PAS domain S-box-containing protein